MRKSLLGERVASPPYHRGFTLTELLVVVGIVVLLLVVTVPAFSAALRSYRGTSGVNVVQAALKAARTAAIRNHTLCSLEFRIDDGGHYMVCEEEKGVDADRPVGLRNYLPADVEFDPVGTYEDRDLREVSWTLHHGWVGEDDSGRDLQEPPTPQRTLDEYDNDDWPAQQEMDARNEATEGGYEELGDIAFRSDGSCADGKGETTLIIVDKTADQTPDNSDPESWKYWSISVMVPHGQVETERVYPPP